MAGDLRLRVNGLEYSGWKSVRVTRGIEAVSGKFELEVSERWPGRSEPWPIEEEDECALVISGEQVITGYVDGRNPSFGPEEHSLSVSGRDKTGDMVDSSADLAKWEFVNAQILTLAKKLAEPFGISVSLQQGLRPPKPVDRLAVDPGETAFEALERACRIVGLLPVSDGMGGLVLSRAGSERATTELVEGKNIKSASGQFEASGRFRTYKVLGQKPGTEEFFGAAASSVKATATDSGVKRKHRMLIVRPEGNVTVEQAQQRAQWEATVRAARAAVVTVTVAGWFQANGSLWPINALVRVRSASLKIDSDMLITEATYGLDDSSGSTTQLTLKRPDAFKPEPVIKPAGLWSELREPVKKTPPAIFPDFDPTVNDGSFQSRRGG